MKNSAVRKLRAKPEPKKASEKESSILGSRGKMVYQDMRRIS
jgi:hypothetical protein